MASLARGRALRDGEVGRGHVVGSLVSTVWKMNWNLARREGARVRSLESIVVCQERDNDLGKDDALCQIKQIQTREGEILLERIIATGGKGNY